MWAGDLRRALHGICGVDRDDMFVHVILVHMVEMAVVKVVDAGSPSRTCAMLTNTSIRHSKWFGGTRSSRQNS